MVQAPCARDLSAARQWLNVGDYHRLAVVGERAPISAWRRARSCSTSSSGSGRRRCWRPPASRDAPAAAAGQRHRAGAPAAGSGAATGLPADCVVGVGGHDHVCGLIAAGADQPGVLLDSLGTAEALSFVNEAPLTDPALGWDGFNQGVIEVDRPLYYVSAGCRRLRPRSSGSGRCYAGVDHATLIAEAGAAPAGSDRVLFLPHLRLGSPPFPDPIGRGAFLGLSAATSRGAMFRALLEGIALDGANILKALQKHLGTGAPERILAIGGSTRNHLLMRLKATAYGMPIAVLDLPDTTCLGAALLGGLAAGVFADLGRGPLAAHRAGADDRPDPDWGEAGGCSGRLIYAAAYAAMRPLHARLLDG